MEVQIESKLPIVFYLFSFFGPFDILLFNK